MSFGEAIQSCFNNSAQTISTMIILKNVDCQDCYAEISQILSLDSGIVNYTIAPSTNKGKENFFIIILIEYKNSTDIKNIKMNLVDKGFIIDDD